MAKQFIREIKSHVNLYRDTLNGIAWIEDGSTGLGISVHPNIDKSGSVTGMKNLGYWGRLVTCKIINKYIRNNTTYYSLQEINGIYRVSNVKENRFILD